MCFIGLAAGCDNAAEIIPLKDAVNMSAKHSAGERQGEGRGGVTTETGNIFHF